MSTVDELLLILQNSLFGCDNKVIITKPKKLFVMAKENAVSGTTYNAIKDIDFDEDIKKRFQREFFKYVQQDQIQNQVIIELSRVLIDSNVEHRFIKGSVVKNMYPSSYMRSRGDIDLLVNGSLQDLKTILLGNGFEFGTNGAMHDVFYSKGVHIDVHNTLYKRDNFVDFTQMGEVWDCGYEVEYMLVYLLYHLKKHIRDGGVGLRSVIDISMYVDYHKKTLDLKQLYMYLEKTNSVEFFENLIKINDRYLGLTLTDSLNNKTPINDEVYKNFTSFIIRSGVHALGSDNNKKVSQIAYNQLYSVGKTKTILNRIFLPYIQMKSMYPKIVKCRIMYPFGVLYRFFHGLIKSSKKIKIEMQMYKSSKDEVEDTINLFREIGL